MSNENPLSGHDLAYQEDVKPSYDGVPGQALDAVRMRSAQLTHSLRRLRDELSRAELPQWFSLQSQLNVTLSQLMSLTSTLQHFHDVLDSTAVYPLPNFPTTSHEGLLTTLLRKKNIPEVDEWIMGAREASDLDSPALEVNEVEKSLNDDKEVTKWALQIFVQEFERHNYKGLRTREENAEDVLMEDTIHSRKPRKPFEVEDILSYIYKGKESWEDRSSNEAAVIS
ncbi:hypothetical protein HG536_0D00950 [Torulaspora globosa]|uniref:Mediator of RNA polymerase II transcription subunit 8 n=1 Tax=Torulaspora globosa TaxID=48254 RepID=A0A7G3ZGD7_9SACH|nr:uncharacterized protein HG536_0D00950 [Torulaspora globosa]QLL32573.1 hypothetical protein HG536_0D00950 [Torulaspora globosa]